MSEILGNVSSFESMGLVDGPGIRYIVFMQGCPLRCLYCHNPETWDASVKKNLVTPSEIVNKVLRYKSYFGKNGGITFSGGEPLLQHDFLLETLKLCKKHNINTCLDTSGYGENFEDILEYVDLVILDVKAVDGDDYTHITQRKIDHFKKFLDYCQKINKPLWLRQVIVPGINDTKESVLKLKEFAKSLKNVEKIELLPYHDMAIKKYNELGIDYVLKDVKPMDKQYCNELQKLLRED